VRGVFRWRSWRDSARRYLRLLFEPASRRQQAVSRGVRPVGCSVFARLLAAVASAPDSATRHEVSPAVGALRPRPARVCAAARRRTARLDAPALATCDESTRPRTRGHTHWLRSLVVFTVTGVPRSEPWRPYGRTVSPERELQLLSTEPWRAAAVSFLVIVAGGSRASSRCACRSRAVLVVEWRLLAQKGLGRLLHRGGTRAGVRIGGRQGGRAITVRRRNGCAAGRAQSRFGGGVDGCNGSDGGDVVETEVGGGALQRPQPAYTGLHSQRMLAHLSRASARHLHDSPATIRPRTSKPRTARWTNVALPVSRPQTPRKQRCIAARARAPSSALFKQ
jgi:hypothetical protein